MNEEKRKCWGCAKYKAFYTKGNSYFTKKDIGFCQYHKKIVSKNECCEQWSFYYVTKCNRKRIVIYQLAEIVNRLTVIEQTLKDQIELDDINLNELK